MSLIFSPEAAKGICANPEAGENLLLEVGFELMNQAHLLLALSLDRQKLDDAGGMVNVDAHGRPEGELHVHVLAVVPDLVAGPRPASSPGLFVLPDAAGLAFPGGALADQPDHDPAVVIHLPVSPISLQPLLTQDLKREREREQIEWWSQRSPCALEDLILYIAVLPFTLQSFGPLVIFKGKARAGIKSQTLQNEQSESQSEPT